MKKDQFIGRRVRDTMGESKLTEAVKFGKKYFLVILFLIGLFMGTAYGAHLDQTTEQEILYSNLKGYLQALHLEQTGLYRDLEAYGVTEIAESIDRYNGMAVYYPVSFIFYLNECSPYIGNQVWHFYIYMLCFLGVAAFYYLICELFDDRTVAMTVTALLFFTPRMFAESHYNNKDMLLLSITLCLFYAGWKLYRKMSWKWVFLFALAGSLATNIKIIGAFLWGVTGLYLVVLLAAERRVNRKTIVKMMICIAAWLAGYVLLTPASFGGLFRFWQYLIESAKDFRWNDYLLFRGQMYNKTTTGMPRAYLPVMILITVPVGILFLMLTGIVKLLGTLLRRPRAWFWPEGYTFVCAAACLVPVVDAVWNRTPDYNGWRHFYFFYAAIMLCAAWGIDWLIRSAAAKEKRKGMTFILGGYCALLAAGVVLMHPYEYAFYNVLAGREVAEDYELDYWDMSFKQAYEKILRADNREQIGIGTITNPAKWGLEEQLLAIRGRNRMRITLCEDWQEADYLIINPTYANMYAAQDYEQIRMNYQVTEQIRSYGNVICEIYQKVQ